MVNSPTGNIIKITGREADIFQSLKESGAFNILYGKITMNFMAGYLQNVVKEEMIYKR